MTRFDGISWVSGVQGSIKGFGGGTQSSTTKSDPWEGQQPYLKSLFGAADTQYQDYTPQYFPQNTVAGFNPGETSAISGIENTGMNGTPALNAADSSVSNILSGDPAHNQAIMAGVLPGLTSSFTQGNSVNNPQMAYAASQGVASALTQDQLNAAQTAQGLYGTRMSGQQAALGAGQTQQTQDQNNLQGQIDRWNYQQQLPYSQINQYANLINGQYGGTSMTTSPQQGLFGSLFSDRRLKENIKRIGTADNGLAIYQFNYLGNPTTCIGLMADEVRDVCPEAVSVSDSGFYMVNYEKALGVAHAAD